MAKFKVGDKVIRVDGKPWPSSKEYLTVTDIWENGIIELNGHATVWEEYELKLYEEVKENKMEKTILEIINEGYTGKKYIHECGTIVYVDYENILRFDYDKLDKKPSDEAMGRFLVLDMKLKEYRKEYTFEEAFKAYEEGKEIESCKFKYKKRNGQDYFYSNTSQAWEKHYEGFLLQEIRNKWYIN